MKVLSKCILLSFTLLNLSACSGVLPVPGGKSTVNDSFYKSNTELKSKLETLKPGMTEQVVFANLGRSKDELLKLDRKAVIESMYGGQNSPYTLGSAVNPYQNIDIKSLSGYQLKYRVVKLKHGLKSPIAIRTDEVGYDYSATMIFKDGILFEEPIVSGGLVDNSKSKTVFDYLNPGMLMKSAGI